jgi:pimeloyl-ACP methyl ester carboxylesterase
LTGRTSDSLLMTKISSVTKTVTHLLEEGQRTMSPSVSNLQDRLNTTIGSVQEMIALSRKYDWDFDNYLEEDVPAAMEYMRTHTESTDGKVLGVGHSMGGIILYAMLATHGRCI